MRILFFFFCWCSVFSAFSQETILLKGKIKADSIIEASVHIVNLTQKIGTVNNANGEFEIKAAINDSILFSSVQYEIKNIIVTSENIQEKYLEVNLVPIALEAVKISDQKLSGNLERGIAGIKIIDPTEFDLPWPKPPSITPSERKLYTATSANVDLLLNIISGRLAMLKKHDANMKRKEFVERAIRQLSESFFLKEFNLQQDELKNFIFFCIETDPNFAEIVKGNDSFQLIEYYQNRISEFLEIRG